MKVLHEFLALLNGNAKDEELLAIVDVDEDIAPAADPDLLPLPGHAEAITRLHSVVHHVLQGGTAAAHVDISRKFTCGGILVSFDNCVHASGHQRAYVKCCSGGRGCVKHEACFKYSVIHRHESEVLCKKKTTNIYIYTLGYSNLTQK